MEYKYWFSEGRVPYGVVGTALDSDIVVSEFEIQLHYYDQLRTKILGNGMNPLYTMA